jgi:hypothetical protein
LVISDLTHNHTPKQLRFIANVARNVPGFVSLLSVPVSFPLKVPRFRTLHISEDGHTDFTAMSTESIQPKLVGIQADLAALIEADEKQMELLGKRAQKNRELLQAVNASLNAFTAQVTGSGKLTDTVRAVIKSLPADRFTAPDLEHALIAQFPTVPLDKGGLRTALWNLTKRGEINCTRKGTNRLPAEYVRPQLMENGLSAGPTARVRRRPEIAAASDFL